MSRTTKAILGACGTWVALRAWAALRPTAFPYFARAIIEVPRPMITRGRLREILEAQPGERMLEVGPGTGYYTLDVAERLAPGGTLDILEVRTQFLEHTIKRAHRDGLANVIATLGDGGAFPYPAGTFDAAAVARDRRPRLPPSVSRAEHGACCTERADHGIDGWWVARAGRQDRGDLARSGFA